MRYNKEQYIDCKCYYNTPLSQETGLTLCLCGFLFSAIQDNECDQIIRTNKTRFVYVGFDYVGNQF